MYKSLIKAILFLLFIQSTLAGPVTLAICQAGCAAVVACYAAAGFVYGTVTAGPLTPAVLLACNAAQGTCYHACYVAFFLPTP